MLFRSVQAGSPLESGTTFTTVAYLSKKYGWEFFEKLRANNLASAGGNSAVIQKVESGERKLGVCLLENALAAQKRGSPIEIIYPNDGAIPIPSVQVIMKDAAHHDAAAQFSDFLLSEDGQKLLAITTKNLEEPRHIPWINLGKLYLERKEFNEALHHFDEALRLDPTNQEARELAQTIRNRMQ